jgi:Peptidase_C39 like family
VSFRRYIQTLSVSFLCGIFFFPTLIRAETLAIPPVAQESPVWCWVTVGEMVFRYYDVPNVNPVGDYQCGIIGARFGPATVCWNNCRACQVPAGNPTEITRMLREYPLFAGRVAKRRMPGLLSTHVPSALSKDQIKEEIDEGRPIIVGISPGSAGSAVSAHVALIIGYDESDEALILTVNDPFPYQYVAPRIDPYLRAGATGGDGQYTINLDSFRRQLSWRETFYGIRPSR